MANFKYEDLFQRNIGVFTKKEQDKIRKLKIAIIGAGGLGGAVAIYLTRLGVGEIRIADTDVFEISNINRQFGAYISTIGMNKAEVIAKEAADINPFCNFIYWKEHITDNNVKRFLEGVDVVVDAIDFFAINDELSIHKTACDNKQWVYTAQCPGETVTFCGFDPNESKFEKTFSLNGNISMLRIAKSFFPRKPREISWTDVVKAFTGKMEHASSIATNIPIGSALLVDLIMSHQIRDHKLKYKFPNLLIFDVTKLKLTEYIDGRFKKI